MSIYQVNGIYDIQRSIVFALARSSSQVLTIANPSFTHTSWYPYAMSLTVTGMCRLDKLLCACLTWVARSLALIALSYRGSDPNWTARVTNFALELECRAARSISRRVSHLLSLSKPNYSQFSMAIKWEIAYSQKHTHINAWTPSPAFQAASTTSLLINQD